MKKVAISTILGTALCAVIALTAPAKKGIVPEASSSGGRLHAAMSNPEGTGPVITTTVDGVTTLSQKTASKIGGVQYNDITSVRCCGADEVGSPVRVMIDGNSVELPFTAEAGMTTIVRTYETVRPDGQRGPGGYPVVVLLPAGSGHGHGTAYYGQAIPDPKGQYKVEGLEKTDLSKNTGVDMIVDSARFMIATTERSDGKVVQIPVRVNTVQGNVSHGGKSPSLQPQ